MEREEILKELCLDLMATINQLEFEADMERGYRYEMEHETKGEQGYERNVSKNN